jgi:predicted nucleic acid-binding protein
MTTVVDSNVIVALWDRDDTRNAAAQSALDAAFGRGNLVVPAPAYAELMAFAGRTESFLDSFFRANQHRGRLEPERTHLAHRGTSLPGLRHSPAQAARSGTTPHPRRLSYRRIRRPE